MAQSERKQSAYRTYGERLSHREFIPWPLRKEDSFDGIAHGLRAWSTERQGGELGRHGIGHLRQLRSYLGDDLVVDYSRADGWRIVPRDPKIDDPNLPIRRPPPEA